MSKSNNTIGNSEGLEYVILYHKGSTEFLKKNQKLLSWREAIGPNRFLKESKEM